MKKALASLGIKMFVLLVCMAFGYYVLGPRLEFSTDGKPRLNLTKSTDKNEDHATQSKIGSRPKVDVFEKLPSSTTTSSGVYSGSREIGSANAPIRQNRKPENRSPSKPDRGGTEPPEELIIDDSMVDSESTIETPVIELESETKPEPAPSKAEPNKPEPKEPADTPKTPSEPPKEPAEPPASSALFRVQVGIFSSRDGANSAAQSLRASGFEAAIVPFQSDGKTMYRVQTLVTKDRQKAEQVSKALQSKGFTAFVSKLD